ncbi:hypothetical protein PF007_g5590 [Phytophthora fragariae]|uniref:Uncharacterized protein n=1 Tax=Phytophthora fragariae TaxID=53985 RepID=A0A6A3T158_9STRA|nr:hypothetical protein PF007_g5590 [Phytophthora fragariae]
MVSLGGVRVNIVEARGILASDDVDTSDPYGTMMLLDAKGQALRVVVSRPTWSRRRRPCRRPPRPARGHDAAPATIRLGRRLPQRRRAGRRGHLRGADAARAAGLLIPAHHARQDEEGFESQAARGAGEARARRVQPSAVLVEFAVHEEASGRQVRRP